MLDPLSPVLARIRAIQTLIDQYGNMAQPARASQETFAASLDSQAELARGGTGVDPAAADGGHPASAGSTGHSSGALPARSDQRLTASASVGVPHASRLTARTAAVAQAAATADIAGASVTSAADDPSTAADAVAARDPRWTDILARDSASLAAGARGPATVSDPNPLYTGTYDTDVEGRRRSDGSLNPIDLPSTGGLSDSELLTARLAESVPSAVLATGQNEGVAQAGKPQNTNDSYDLLAWVGQLQAMKAGQAPPYVQDNGYVWTPSDIDTNLKLALDQVALNKQQYNDRWQTRWTLLRQNGLGAVADQEQASIQLTA